jgi:hypothetical protein
VDETALARQTKLITVIPTLQGRYIERFPFVTGAWLTTGKRGEQREEEHFQAELARVRASGVLAESGRLRELFDYLAARGPEAPPASQADIADSVFGQLDAEGDDATARVYVHRLRKRLEEFYAGVGEGPDGARLVLPAGTYALRLAGNVAEAGAPRQSRASQARWWAVALALTAAFAAIFLLGRASSSADFPPPANAFWQPFLDSDRPIIVVVGDYYLFGEIDPVRPEQSRLIRDFRIDSPMDLAALQEAEPDRYGFAEDVGLTYLPFSTAYGLREIVPILARGGREVTVVAASELHADSIRDANIVYIGLIGAMGLLEDTAFTGSGFRVGETYDQLIDTSTRQLYTSDEARRLAAPVFYRDYGYVARFRTAGGSLVAVVAGARETALRGLAPIMAGETLPGELDGLAGDGEGLEALFQVTGQQGADLSERMLVARARD